jgi:hypothetical protein
MAPLMIVVFEPQTNTGVVALASIHTVRPTPIDLRDWKQNTIRFVDLRVAVYQHIVIGAKCFRPVAVSTQLVD